MAIACHIKDAGGIRKQFCHVIDSVPTILQATGIPAPVMVDGIAQTANQDNSLAYTFDKADANAPLHHQTQYFEMMGVQGLYDHGWMLSAVPLRPPWDLLGKAIQNPAADFKFQCTTSGTIGRSPPIRPQNILRRSRR